MMRFTTKEDKQPFNYPIIVDVRKGSKKSTIWVVGTILFIVLLLAIILFN